jgi:RNA polymerase sigma-70 factor, ECF subfamily
MTETATLRLLARQPLDTSRQRLERLYRACRDDLYAYVATLLRDRHLAEDVTAQAFERAFRRQRLFDPRRGSERAWLFAIARNAALDELRRRKRTVPVADARRTEDADRESEQLESILRTASILDAVLSLPARERELIALKFYAGLTNSEIARVLGVSNSNAGTMLHRTIAKLRKACNEHD